MKIVFRTDASIQIGTGHVMRCLALADALRERGVQCRFISRQHQGHLFDLIKQHGHEAVLLPVGNDTRQPPTSSVYAGWLGTDWLTDAQQTRQAMEVRQPVDWLVVDHYALDYNWEQALRPLCRKLMVIDDLADRFHDCDLLLDQNLGRTEQDYHNLVPPTATLLISPRYALLRPEFAKWREYSLARRNSPELKQLLITMGGVDKDNVTSQALEVIKTCQLPPDMQIIVVMGPQAPWLGQVQAQAAQMPWPTQVLVGVNNMAQLMAESDLAIGAAGSTSWERCCLGLPTIQVVLANNQREAAIALAELNAAISILSAEEFTIEAKRLLDQISNEKLKLLTSHGTEICNGCGTKFVVKELLSLTFIQES